MKQEQEVRDARLQFFTMIAHEIRTPVTLIIGPLENLKEQWQKTVSLLMGMTASLDEKAKGWRIEEVEVGLTLSAKGELLFIAEAGAEGSVKVKLARK